MKDSTYELINAIITLLGSTLTYNSYIFSVYDDLPENPTARYVWFPLVQLVDESNHDPYSLKIQLTIQIVTTGSKNKASRQAIVAIGTIILTALIRKNLTMTNHYLVNGGDLISITHGTTFQDGGGLTLTGDYILEFTTEQK